MPAVSATGSSAMGEDIRFFPAEQIELGPRRQEGEAGLGMLQPTVADEPRHELVAQRMQVQHVGSGIFELRLRQTFPPPNRRIAAAWRCRCRGAPSDCPSGRAGRCRSASAARRSWCRTRANRSRRRCETARRCRSGHSERSSGGTDRSALRRGWAPRVWPAAILMTSAVPSPGESWTTQSRSRRGIRPSVSVSIAIAPV